MLYTCLKLGQRIIFTANQHEFLTQIMDHIHGNEKEGIPKCTNLPELEKKHGKKLYGFPKTKEDYDNFQIMFIPYQSLISKTKGTERLSWIKPNFGTVAIDEVHRANATCFAGVISSLRTKYRIGCSGTLIRKDGKHFIAEAILGPANATTSIEALIPTVYVHLTTVEGKVYQPGPASWVYAMQYISGHKKRNAQIVEYVMKDLANGHNIVIPVTFKNHVVELQRLINEKYGSHICGTFTGGGGKKNKEDRKLLLTKVKDNEIRVTVGIRSLLQLGLNVPSWSAIYEILPISNEPNLKQETARICTPKPGKRSPIVRLFVDLNQPQSAGCARSTIGHMFKFKYHFASSSLQQDQLATVLSTGRRKGPIDHDDTTPVRTQRQSKGVVATEALSSSLFGIKKKPKT
jgi:superfamily II DNA or RNA helicase